MVARKGVGISSGKNSKKLPGASQGIKSGRMIGAGQEYGGDGKGKIGPKAGRGQGGTDGT